MRLWRPARVFFSVLPLLVSILRDWRGWVFFGAPRELTAEQHRDRARRLTTRIAALGAGFIKGAQVIATRADLLPPAYLDELKTLQDQVPPFPSTEAEEVVRRELGRGVREIFEEWTPAPIAAASLGQVHLARYKGERVAVKILRPGVEDLIAGDLAVVRFIVRLVHCYTDSHLVRSFWNIVREFERVLAKETDFRNEEAHAERFRANFSGVDDIVIPRCHSELTTKRIVVFEYIDGVRIDDTEGLRARGQDIGRIVKRLLYVYIKMVVRDGFLHADPHPGNLLVDARGRLAILDFGMAIEFDEQTRVELLKAAFSIAEGDLDGLIASLYHLKVIESDINAAVARDAAETLLSIQMSKDFSPRKIQEIADEILRTFYKFPLRMPQQLVYLFRASALVEGIGFQSNPNFSSVREGTPVIKDMLRDFIRDRPKTALRAARDWVKDARQVLASARRIIRAVEREELRLRWHPSDLGELQSSLSALMARAMLFASALASAIIAAILYASLRSLPVAGAFALCSAGLGLAAAVVPLRRRRPLG